ncbi:ribosome biogenesis GTPase Der [Yunchengibacter salinarum]|uniref:ribosome biogenesis GTPase Der n=1 Tax=Yunchengibacter salinarum TaxID=3133399 RepID=UPI0035B5A463
MAFTLAIVGRPNVGKSTLFNRLVGKRLALVDDTPGVTRDRREGQGSLADLSFNLIDTAGLEDGDQGSLSHRMRMQTEKAMQDADVVLMLYDARAGVTPLDSHFAAELRRLKAPVILVANKCEGRAVISGLYEAYSLGLGEPIAISAEHDEGMAELYQAIVDAVREGGGDPYADESDDEDGKSADGPTDGLDLPDVGDLDFEFDDPEEQAEAEAPLRLAVVGRPNAGKSTLINHLVGEERLVTGPEAGLTRDSIAIEWEWNGLPVRLFDTAGLRRRARVMEKLEKLSVNDTLRAIQFAEIVVLLIDAERGVEKQDLKIAERIIDEGRAVIIAVNKWDLVTDRLALNRSVKDALTRSLPQLRGVEVINFSALTGKGVQKMMPAVEKAVEVWNARVPTGAFNRWLAATTDQHPPPMVSGRRIKIRYGAQVKTRPPTFALFCNMPEDLPGSYKRYLENELRRDFDLPGTPIRLMLRKGENPYASRRRRKG